MIRQFMELKEQIPDGVLFFRMGDFYEIFGDDALEIAPKLDIVLTSREKNSKTGEKIPFCGVPHHSAKNYWVKLLRLGYRVGIADQVEDPKLAKGLVRREITRILSPGSVDDLDVLSRDEPNHLLALYEVPKIGQWAICFCDLSTREFRAGNLPSLDAAIDFVKWLKPKEVLLRKFFIADFSKAFANRIASHELCITAMSEDILRDQERQKKLLNVAFGSGDLAGQPCGSGAGLHEVVCSLLAYLDSNHVNFESFGAIASLRGEDAMSLDETAIRDLEVFETAQRRNEEGGLLRIINRSLTPMGVRKLRQSLAAPFLSTDDILDRRSLVEAFYSSNRLDQARQNIREIGDLTRLATKVATRQLQIGELTKLRTSLRATSRLVATLTEMGHEVLASKRSGLTGFAEPLRILERTFVAEPSAVGTDLNVFQEGIDTILDEKRNLSRNGQKEVDTYEEKLRSESGISSLKVKHHKNFGLLIEVTKANLTKVPQGFVRRQTMVNCERFMTVQLQELETELFSASEQAVERERFLYGQFIGDFAGFGAVLKKLAEEVAELDVAQGLAWKAKEAGFCMPAISESSSLRMVNCRHPVVETFVGKHDFVANTIELNPQQRHLLITGPNMGGKSTIMRQTAICSILNQIGSFVPADSAEIPIFDRIFTRVGASDDLSQGKSTFMVEMTEAARIVRQATTRSLVILDEVGRGTSTEDGMAIALSIFEELVESVGCYTMFATHYHEIIPLAEDLGGVKLMQTEVLESGKNIRFTHRFIGGACSSSFGLEVAKLAGIPRKIIDRAANHIIKRPIKNTLRQGAAGKLPPLEEMGLTFENPAKSAVTKKIAEIDINAITPLEALNILSELRAEMNNQQGFAGG